MSPVEPRLTLCPTCRCPLTPEQAERLDAAEAERARLIGAAVVAGIGAARTHDYASDALPS